MKPATPKDPLEGKTLERILTELVEHYGWESLGQDIRINCFTNNPSIKSSLYFLGQHPGPGQKWERLFEVSRID